MRPGRGAVALETAAFAHYCLFGHTPRPSSDKKAAVAFRSFSPPAEIPRRIESMDCVAYS